MSRPIPPIKVYEAETQFVQDVLLEFGSREWLFIWRNNTGGLPASGGKGWVTFGYPGSSDTLGLMGGELLPPILRGRFVGIEGKRDDWEKQKNGRKKKNGRTTLEDQDRFRRKVEYLGGIYILAEQLIEVYQSLEAAGVPRDVLWA